MVAVISVCVITLAQNETQQINTTLIDNIIFSNIPVNSSEINEREIVEDLYGKDSIDDDRAHLDLIAFDQGESKVVYATARKKLQLVEKKINETRRKWYSQGHVPNKYYEEKAIDLMQQSIYATRIRINDTRPIRKKYSVDPIYNIAILYGSLMQIRNNMENILGTIKKFTKYIKFKWYLVLYERAIAASVDVDFLVQKIFMFAKQTHKTMDTDQANEGYGQALGPPKNTLPGSMSQLSISDIDINNLNLDAIQG